MEGAGIRFHQRPAVIAGFQHMHGLGRARYHANALAAVAGLGAQNNLLLLPRIHHLNGRGQHGPHGGLVGDIHGRAPVAARMLRMIAAQMRGRDAGALIGKGRLRRGGRRRLGGSSCRLRALHSLADGQHGGIRLPLIGKDQAIRALGQRLGKELPVQRQHMQPAQQHALGQDDSHIRAALRGQAQRRAPTGRQKVAQLHALAGQEGAVLHIGQALRQRKARQQQGKRQYQGKNSAVHEQPPLKWMGSERKRERGNASFLEPKQEAKKAACDVKAKLVKLAGGTAAHLPRGRVARAIPSFIPAAFPSTTQVLCCFLR